MNEKGKCLTDSEKERIEDDLLSKGLTSHDIESYIHDTELKNHCQTALDQKEQLNNGKFKKDLEIVEKFTKNFE